MKIEKGPLRVVPGNTFTTRSFGNFPAKTGKFGGNSKVLIAKPSVRSFKISDDFDFIILCSTGIVENLSNHDVLECFWKGAQSCSAQEVDAKVAQGINSVLQEAKNRKSENNLSIILIGFKNLQSKLI